MITSYILGLIATLWLAVGVDKATTWLWWIVPAVKELYQTKSLQQPLWLTVIRVAFGFCTIVAFGAFDYVCRIHKCIQCGHLVKITVFGIRVPFIGGKSHE
jgi:hypothetical protein